jgi:DNA polymerase/3'-5' exonuclease PolX
MSTNSDLADIFREIADLLDLAGEKFKPEAYRRASRSLDSLSEDVRAVSGRGELDSIPGVGAAISEKIREYLRTGAIEYYDRTRRASPPGLLEIMRLPGIGPKTARRFWIELGVEGPQELSAAVAAGRLVALRGFGPRKIELIQKAVTPASAPGRRTPLRAAARRADGILAALRRAAPIDQIEVAGSLRRGRESVGDIDILVTATEPERVFDAFSALPDRREIVLRGSTKETIVFDDGLQVDLRVVEPLAFGAAWQYFTGSKDHNVRLRSLARDHGLKINEYGVFRGEECVGGATEAEVYATLGLSYIPPEIREDQGEIAQAAAGTLPRLVETTDLRGDLHVHASGDASEKEIASTIAQARALGWEYLGVLLSPVTAEARGRWRSLAADAPRILFGEELDHWDLPRSPAAADRPDYHQLRADRAGPPPATEPSARYFAPLLVGHLRTGAEGSTADPIAATPWIAWAQRSGVALEVTGSGAEDGLDASLVHRLIEGGGRIHIAAGDGDLLSRELAVRTARRGWATRERVLNAAALSELRLPGRTNRPTSK